MSGKDRDEHGHEHGRVRIIERVTLHKNFLHLQKVTAEHVTVSGGRQVIEREVHDHGNAAAILLYDPKRRVTVMVRQLRLPVHLNGDDGWLIEAPAGMLDGEHPDVAICREAMEETGFRVEKPRHLFDAYASPGSLTEKVSFYAAEIDLSVRAGEGGGHEHEQEDIEVLEIPIDAALEMVTDGRICDAKTIILLQWAARHYGIEWPLS